MSSMSGNNKYRFAFVMLNYNSPEMTRRCVESINEKIHFEHTIVIVDNASKDGSGKELEELYQDCSNIKVIINDDNLGFSKGLNVGYRYAKSLGYNLIALINNDTEILSDNFCELCVSDYEKYDYAILGPTIVNNKSKENNSNPYRFAELPVADVKRYLQRMIKRHVIVETMCKVGILDFLFNLYISLQKSIDGIRNKKEIEPENSGEVILNCGIHGCFFVCSPAYVEMFEGLEEITFAYFEEWILYQQCKNNNLKTIFEPQIRIWHNEHTTQKKISKNKNKQFMYRANIEIEAAKKLLKFIIENENA